MNIKKYTFNKKMNFFNNKSNFKIIKYHNE